MPCVTATGKLCGLDAVTLENGLVKAFVVPGKGADLLEFIWKESGVNCFYRSDVPFEAYLARDLRERRLRSHSELGLGGWMTVLPHRAKYKDIELTQESGGLAATVPWEYHIAESGGDAVSVICGVRLPLIPMRIEKTFSLREGSAALTVDETVTFHGDGPVVFTWTEHALFGGDFVSADTDVLLPSDTAFDAWAHMAGPEREPASFEHAASAFPLKDGIYDLRRPLPASYNGSEFIVYKDLKKGEAGLYNKKKGLRVELLWDETRFPFMRSLYRSGELGSVVGLEPGNDLFSGLEASLAYGTYTRMLPGETLSARFTLRYRKDGAAAGVRA